MSRNDDVLPARASTAARWTSLWTPNTRILEITEDGISARDVIPGKITPEEMEGVAIKQLKKRRC